MHQHLHELHHALSLRIRRAAVALIEALPRIAALRPALAIPVALLTALLAVQLWNTTVDGWVAWRVLPGSEPDLAAEGTGPSGGDWCVEVSDDRTRLSLVQVLGSATVPRITVEPRTVRDATGVVVAAFLSQTFSTDEPVPLKGPGITHGHIELFRASRGAGPFGAGWRFEALADPSTLLGSTSTWELADRYGTGSERDYVVKGLPALARAWQRATESRLGRSRGLELAAGASSRLVRMLLFLGCALVTFAVVGTSPGARWAPLSAAVLRRGTRFFLMTGCVTAVLSIDALAGHPVHGGELAKPVLALLLGASTALVLQMLVAHECEHATAVRTAAWNALVEVARRLAEVDAGAQPVEAGDPSETPNRATVVTQPPSAASAEAATALQSLPACQQEPRPRRVLEGGRRRSPRAEVTTPGPDAS
jgi:hypothetical protein